MNKIVLLLFLSLFTINCSVYKPKEEIEIIVGTWINEESPELKMIFKNNGRCEDYINGVLSDTYLYAISKTSPQCGQVVPTGELYSYLKLVNTKDSNEVYCYEILSLNDEYLQIRWVERGCHVSYKRQ